eukprot:TRINITY_DN3132_c0_g1_i1.p1 TRINITY_DN3132_c0_g1~~TRINITY_DN3132_c0_g1_i1.p1  ORF type:complete len:353 (+),score=58.33 TRINITY_DN3132_c0_g1_i1:1026-2084(+)
MADVPVLCVDTAEYGNVCHFCPTLCVCVVCRAMRLRRSCVVLWIVFCVYFAVIGVDARFRCVPATRPGAVARKPLLALCSPAKSACTSIVRVLQFVEQRIVSDEPHRDSSPCPGEWNDAPVRIQIVRSPFLRLLSLYIEKARTRHHIIFDEQEAAVIRGVSRNDTLCDGAHTDFETHRESVSFCEFVVYVASRLDSNRHWIPVAHDCQEGANRSYTHTVRPNKRDEMRFVFESIMRAAINSGVQGDDVTTLRAIIEHNSRPYPHVNRHVQLFYTDRLRRFVERVWAEDIELGSGDWADVVAESRAAACVYNDNLPIDSIVPPTELLLHDFLVVAAGERHVSARVESRFCIGR